jgi:hypothetical protein
MGSERKGFVFSFANGGNHAFQIPNANIVLVKNWGKGLKRVVTLCDAFAGQSSQHQVAHKHHRHICGLRKSIRTA